MGTETSSARHGEWRIVGINRQILLRFSNASINHRVMLMSISIHSDELRIIAGLGEGQLHCLNASYSEFDDYNLPDFDAE